MAARVMVKEGFTKRISNLELSKPLDLDGLLSSKKDIASTEPPYKSPITVQVANNSDLIDALQWAQSSGCSMFFPSIILGYSANFASVRDLDKNPNHYKNYSSILEATLKILSKDLNAAETENTTLNVEYSDLKKKVEVLKNDNAKLSSLNESLNQAISNNELITKAKQKKQEEQEIKGNGYIEITWIHMAITAALIIAIFICVLIWQQRKAMEGTSAPSPLPPKQAEAPPAPYETLPSTETETQPSPPSSCLNSKDSITVHYDSKLGNKKSAVRDDIVKKLGIVCKELTTEECRPTLDQIIRFEKDDPKDKAISVPLVCLSKAVEQGIYDLSITKSKITPKK
jgi:regulator of replication initiation timing